MQADIPVMPLKKRKHIAILPENAMDAEASPENTRFLRLPHPRTRLPSLFLPYTLPTRSNSNEMSRQGSSADMDTRREGILEVQAISPEEEKKRSWFVGEEVVSDGKLPVMTPFDPIFLLIALITALSHSGPAMFQSHDDLFDAIAHLRYLITAESSTAEGVESSYEIGEDAQRFGALSCVLLRLETICEQQLYDGTKLYRISQPLILEALRHKITSLTEPTTGIFGPYASTELGVARPGTLKANEEMTLNVEETAPYPTVTRGLNRAAVGDGRGVPIEAQLVIRQKAAINIISNYLPVSMTEALVASYAFPTIENASVETQQAAFVLSTTYLPGRASAAALGDAVSTGNGFGAAAKEKAKRAAMGKGGRGVEALKKVNVSGMKKLGDFFMKKPKTSTDK